nr:retrovirus-related Pol polyprotein from transposon TNT 1-94 [Tanacetum cinerariifolium]
MTSTTSNLDSASPYVGNEFIIFANGQTAHILHVGKTHITPHIALQDVLVVPHITKTLLSISKLTHDDKFDVLFSDNMFLIQNRLTKETLTRDHRKNGLYVLAQGQQAFLTRLSSRRSRASFELWHRRLGHVSYDIITLLNKFGCLSTTSILPIPNICSSCQLSKSKRLPFENNMKRASHVLDLIHCDLLGPSPVTSIDGYRYYVIFVDDYSRFTWFYPLKAKSDFPAVFETFVCFVQT